MNYYTTPRTHPCYDIPRSDFPTACFEQVWDAGLKDEVNDGIAYVEEVEGYYMTALPFLANHSPYGCLVYVFPGKGRPVHHSLHEYASPDIGTYALDFAQTFALATQVVAQEREGLEIPPEVVVNQHLGGFEVTQGLFFKTTARQTHFHVFTRDETIIRNHPDLYTQCETPSNYGEKYLYTDPFSRLARSILKKHFPDIQPIENGGVHLGSYALSSTEDMSQSWQALTRTWYEEWHEIAEIFSNFTYDDNERYAVRSRQDIDARLEHYLASRYDTPPTEVVTVLKGLSRCIKGSAKNDPENWFYRGPAGLIALRYDAKPVVDLNAYARVLAISDKSALQMRDFRTIKDTKRMASPTSVAFVRSTLQDIIDKASTMRHVAAAEMRV